MRGALAKLYGELGGKTLYFGKPHGPVYGIARRKIAGFAGAPIPDARILGVGDGPLTDIKGANDAGLDALFITGGIAAADCGTSAEKPEEDRVTHVLERAGVRAVGAMPRLVW